MHTVNSIYPVVSFFAKRGLLTVPRATVSAVWWNAGNTVADLPIGVNQVSRAVLTVFWTAVCGVVLLVTYALISAICFSESLKNFFEQTG